MALSYNLGAPEIDAAPVIYDDQILRYARTGAGMPTYSASDFSLGTVETAQPVAQPTLSYGLGSVDTMGAGAGSSLSWGDAVPSVGRGILGNMAGIFSDLGKVVGGSGSSGTYDDAILRQARTGSAVPTYGGEVVTGNVDGSSGYIGGLKDLAGAVLSKLGAGGGDAEIVPVSSRSSSAGLDGTTIALVLGTAAVAYFIAVR